MRIAQNLKKMAMGASLAIVTQAALAGSGGGMEAATSAAEEIKTGLYAFVGVVAAIYLLWLGVMAFSEKKSWSDFGWGVVYVSLVGAAMALATWAWSLFA